MGFVFNLFAKRDKVELSKADSGVWMVRKNLKIVFMGPKEKCQTYMSQLRIA